jgi:hypothetical protein
LVPLVATLALNWQNAKAFNVRYVIVGLPAFIVLLAVGVASLGAARRWLAAALITTCLLSLGNHYFNPRFAKEDVKRALAAVEARMLPGDCIFAPTVWQVVAHYQTNDAPLHFVYGDPPGIAQQQLRELYDACDTFWYLRARPWVDDPNGGVLADIEKHCVALENMSFPGVQVTRYQKRGGGETD